MTPIGAGTQQARTTLSVRGVVKRFGAVRANDGLDITFEQGRVHGLLGENGAGKSTLIKILAGLYRPDAGSVEIGGRSVELPSPSAARSHGIAVVHQESTLIPALTVQENVSLVEGGLGRLDRSLGARLVRSGQELGFAVDPKARVEVLSVGQRQRVEIARALMHRARFVVLDEPTPVLSPSECAELFRLLRRLARTGTGVVLATHRLDEARNHCDQVTVLRRGRVVAGSRDPRSLSERSLVSMLVGERDVRGFASGSPRMAGDTLLEATGLRGAPPHGRTLRGVDLAVRAGEVLGIAGVEGNGQRELAAALVGAWQPDAGSVTLRGTPLGDLEPAELSRLVGDVPDDEQLALVPDMTVWENLSVLEFAWRAPPHPRQRRRARQAAADLVREFEIKTQSLDTPVRHLSGGNRRRLILARELGKDPLVVVASYPLKGLDVRAAEKVKAWVARATSGGSAVVYIAAELDELVEVSDRIAVLSRGRVSGMLEREHASIAELGRLMAGDGEAAGESV